MSEHTLICGKNHDAEKAKPRKTRSQMLAERQAVERRFASVLPDFVSMACEEMDIGRDELFSPYRLQRIARPRQVLWWLLKNHPDASFSHPMIAEAFNRDHTTVVHGVQQARALMSRPRYERLRIAAQRICNRLSWHGYSDFKVGL